MTRWALLTLACLSLASCGLHRAHDEDQVIGTAPEPVTCQCPFGDASPDHEPTNDDRR